MLRGESSALGGSRSPLNGEESRIGSRESEVESWQLVPAARCAGKEGNKGGEGLGGGCRRRGKMRGLPR